ncbi:MAG: hypothetical protein F6K50_02595 [Moorea sp. SIO3I7]|nr:hypothetical protein [Moorena sp. SIO3I7]
MARDFNTIVPAIESALVNGVDHASKEHNIPDKTLYQYLKRYREDSKFRNKVDLKKFNVDNLWITGTTDTIKTMISELNRRAPLAETNADARIIKELREVLEACVKVRLQVSAFHNMNGVLEETIVSKLNNANEPYEN